MFWSKNESTIQWTFDIDFLKSSLMENDKSFDSQVFPAKTFPKLWYSYTMKPNQNGSVWIYFNCFSAYEEVKVNLSIKTWKSADFFSSAAKKLECTFKNSGSNGIELFTHKTFLDFNDKNITVYCDISITVKQNECNDCFLGNKLFNSCNKDLKVIIEEKEIMVHKTILETFSPIFKKMIEAQNGDENVLEITDCDIETVENVFNFCYGFAEDISSDMDELIETLKFSSKYEIKDLKNEIEFKLIPQISNENICKISNAAIESKAENLKSVCQSKLIQFVKRATVIKEMENLDCNFAKKVLTNVCIPEGYMVDPLNNIIPIFLIIILLGMAFMNLLLIIKFMNSSNS